MHGVNDNRNDRILIIDDNPNIHEDFRKVLAPKSTENELKEAEKDLFGGDTQTTAAALLSVAVESAYQGEEGLEKVLRSLEDDRPFALAFVDMRMPPGWDGLTTIERLWKVDPDLQVVICTAYSDSSWHDICQRLGTTDKLFILKKPFDNAEVCQLALGLIEKWRLGRMAKCHLDSLERMVAERTREIELAHRETESLLTSISSVLIGLDAKGTITRWNESAERLFQITATNAMGKRFEELSIPWDDPQAAKRYFGESQTGPSVRQSFKLHVGSDVRVLGISRYPIENNGECCGSLCLGIDLTEQAQLEQQLHQAQKLESVGQLAAGVAHEINTPMQYVGDNLQFLHKRIQRIEPLLQAITQLLELSSDDDTSAVHEAISEAAKTVKLQTFLPQISEAITDSRDGIQHVSRIVRAMKEFAHPGQEEQHPVDINRALESTIAVSTNEWKYVAELSKDLAADLPLIPAFAGELNQVFLNILVNAAHAIGEATNEGNRGKGTIHISTRHDGDQVEIAIADSGSGISEDIRTRIFDPFFTTKEVGKGTGQGLAIAFSVVVQKHCGKLWCDSQTGQGTTFFISLPISSVSEQNSEDSASVPSLV